MISMIQFAIKGKVKCDKTFRVLAKFLLNSFYYPVFELLTEQEKMRVLKHRAVFNLMHAIQQF